MTKKQTKKQEAMKYTEKDILLNKWYGIATRIFTWKNLPKGVKGINIEKMLYNSGKCVFINDELLGFMALNVNLKGAYNYNDEPTKWQATGLGYNKSYNIDNSILIKNNLTMTPTINYIDFQCERMLDIENTHTINLNVQKTPIFLSGSEDELLSMKNIVEKIIGGEVAVYTNKGMGNKPFEVHPPNVAYIAKDLHDDYNVYENRIKEYLGLDAISIDKKERLISGEGDANDEHINANLSVFLDARLEAVEELNNMFKFDPKIAVSINPHIFDTLEEENVLNDENKQDSEVI